MRIAELITCVILVIVGAIVLWDVYQTWKQGKADDSTIWVGVIATVVTIPALYTAATIIDNQLILANVQ